MPEPTWLLEAVVLAVHRRLLAEHGGAEGVRDASLLASALARPRQLSAYGDPEPDLAALAVAYAFGIARNHPFVDGNKRTSYVASRVFLILNGSDIEASRDEKYVTFLRLAQGDISESELAAWIREHLVSGRQPPR